VTKQVDHEAVRRAFREVGNRVCRLVDCPDCAARGTPPPNPIVQAYRLRGVPSCTYLACTEPATTKIDPPYDRAWYGCDTHAPGMIEAWSKTARPNDHPVRVTRRRDLRHTPTAKV
jgi:hypothetical protein